MAAKQNEQTLCHLIGIFMHAMNVRRLICMNSFLFKINIIKISIHNHFVEWVDIHLMENKSNVGNVQSIDKILR